MYIKLKILFGSCNNHILSLFFSNHIISLFFSSYSTILSFCHFLLEFFSFYIMLSFVTLYWIQCFILLESSDNDHWMKFVPLILCFILDTSLPIWSKLVNLCSSRRSTVKQYFVTYRNRFVFFFLIFFNRSPFFF